MMNEHPHQHSNQRPPMMNGQPFIQNMNAGLVNPNVELIPTMKPNNLDEAHPSINQVNPIAYASSLNTNSPNFAAKGLNYENYPPQQDVINNNQWIYPPAQQQQTQLQQFQVIPTNYELNQGIQVPQFNANLPEYGDFSIEQHDKSSFKADSLYSDGDSPTTMTTSTSSSPSYTYTKSSNSSISSAESHSHDSPNDRKSSTPIAKANTRIGKDGTIKIKRSRMGCLTCRQRKKRCCESKPSCQECRRLGLTCTWPLPGLEHKNRPRNSRNENEGMHYDAYFGNIKILRGIVESS